MTAQQIELAAEAQRHAALMHKQAAQYAPYPAMRYWQVRDQNEARRLADIAIIRRAELAAYRNGH